MSQHTPTPAYLHTIRKMTRDEQWLAAQVRRIAPHSTEPCHECGYVRALEILAIELRNERDALNL